MYTVHTLYSWFDTKCILFNSNQNNYYILFIYREKEESLACLKNYVIDNYSNAAAVFKVKQQELSKLIEEETSAIANDNYDLAEELAVKIDQIKDDLESAKYKVPTLDDKVNFVLLFYKYIM